jgi:hypothetical protein
MGEKGDNTNLASEFYVLSMLYRIGANPCLTLKNKKSIDLIVEKQGKALTIDVKGLTDETSFPVDNCDKRDKGHFLVFLSFVNNIDKPSCVPESYIVPSEELDKLIYTSPQGKKRVQLGTLRKFKKEYQDKWTENFI